MSQASPAILNIDPVVSTGLGTINESSRQYQRQRGGDHATKGKTPLLQFI
jgi:hypothetical protein